MTANQVNTASDIDGIVSIVSNLVGKECWRVKYSYGGQWYLDFGQEVQGTVNPKHTLGEWQLSTCGTRFELFQKDHLLTRSEEETEEEKEAIKKKMNMLIGTVVIKVEVSFPSLGLSLSFSDDLRLSIMPVPEDDEYDIPYWHVVAPGNRVLEVGPNNQWIYRRFE